MNVSEALQHATDRLAAAGVPDAAWDAELLVRHVLGIERAALLAAPEAALGAEAEARLGDVVARRAAREPLQHITGHQPFWRHDFLVSPDVLVPRRETELLIELALEELRPVPRPVVVDVGTGSGCIALSLAAERADAVVHAVDSSPAALAVAAENARRLGLAHRVRLHRGDLLEPVADLRGAVDLVVSNPPYVDPSEWPSLMPEVRDHEPASALLPPGGGDRYAVYRRLIPEAQAALGPRGRLVLEVGQGMAGGVAGLCLGAGFERARTAADLQGIERAVVASKA